MEITSTLDPKIIASLKLNLPKIYGIAQADFNRLPEAGWEFRDRHIWSFSENDVAQITLHQNGKTRQIVHNGPNKWSLAPGSQGIITDAAIEETAHRLG